MEVKRKKSELYKDDDFYFMQEQMNRLHVSMMLNQYQQQQSIFRHRRTTLNNVIDVLILGGCMVKSFSCENNVVCFELGYSALSEFAKHDFFNILSRLQRFFLFDVVGEIYEEKDYYWQKIQGVLDMKPDVLLILKGLLNGMASKLDVDVRLLKIEKEWVCCQLYFSGQIYPNAETTKKTFTAVTGLNIDWDGGKKLKIQRNLGSYNRIDTGLEFLAHKSKQRTANEKDINYIRMKFSWDDAGDVIKVPREI